MKAGRWLVACSICATHAAGAQSIDELIAAAATPSVVLSYEARADVCGNGRSIRFGNFGINDRFGRCEYGPVQVRLGIDGGRIRSIRTTVGGESRPDGSVTDLGSVPATEAAAWFLDLAGSAPAHVAEDAILPAVIADAPNPWRELLAIARDRRIATDVRRNAVLWVGHSAAREATRELVAIVDGDANDTEVRKAAVYAISRGDEPERGDHLIRIAQSHRNAEVVAAAFFWLADSPDARALALFERVLSNAGD